jgi:DNA-binding response OmpR family regulator
MVENGKKILIVEDEPEIANVLKMRLEANNYQILLAEDGVEGLNKARTEKPDLIVLDIRLPKLDGFKVSRMLKFDEKYAKIPIIMLTARVQQADVEQGMDAGANAYMTKPYKAEDLLAKIKELIGS